MLYVTILALVLGSAASSLSPSVHLTVVQDPSVAEDFSALNLLNCTNDSQRCYVELNNLGTKLSMFNSLSIKFENTPENFLLHTRLAFQNYTQLELLGVPHSKTTITCTNWTNNGFGAGMTFTNVSNFSASSIIFKKCGYQHKLTKTDKIFWSAFVFDTCKNVRLTSVSVQDAIGFGVSMIDCIGNVYFESCLFSNNSAILNLGSVDSGGGGVYLEVTSDSSSHQSNITEGVYALLNCTFKNNIAHTSTVYPEKDKIRIFGQGGGLLISFKGSAFNYHFTLHKCKFINNSAVWGGGLHLFITESSSQNTIIVNQSLFEGNKATAGGGGMAIYMVSHSSCILKNNISILFSKFSKNQANSQGGGTLIHSLLSRSTKHCGAAKHTLNYLKFEFCEWCNNAASYSGAIDIKTRVAITESFPIVPVFSSCFFKKNKINLFSQLVVKNPRYKEIVYGKASLMVLGSIILFENSVKFTENYGTALYAIASEIMFSSKTNATFLRNQGRNGGAIALFSSTLSLGNYSQLNFTKNKAYEFGGAIYSEIQVEHDLHQNLYGLNCFIHCQYCKSVTLVFERNCANFLENGGNSGSGYMYSFGRSIYDESILSCVSKEAVAALTSNTTANVSAFLDSIANFEFIGSNPFDEVVSSAANFKLSKQPETLIIPGKEFYVPLVTIDSFGHQILSDYKAFLQHGACSNGSITIDPKHIYLPTNKLKLYGDPGSKCSISVEREGSRLFSLSFKISVAQCPPGYILTINKQINSSRNYSTMECVCAHQVANGAETYRGILNCNDHKFQVKVLHYYWVGYESDDASYDNLVTAYCPSGFCTYKTSSYVFEHDLPGIANKSILDKFVCDDGRTGMICGSCKTNNSVYFHSPNFRCKENYLCSIGWVFYLLSEVFTLTLLFAVILCFNISFTTGALNGFIFYAQIVEILGSSSDNTLGPSWTISMTRISIFIYHFLNLDFFYLDSLSFCLWEGATTLDIIAIKYLTIVLAFALVLGVFIIMNLCIVKSYTRRLQLRGSFIHGISTFLVISFAQTVKVTFYIFSPGFVLKRGDKISRYQVQYDGDVQLFSTVHLKYVIPALFLFLSIVAIPTFFLMCYPLGFKALHKCGVNETKITKLQQIFFINRLRPLLDSFQGCYKDKYRCFAGLYFIYRILFLASNSYSYGPTQFHVLIQIQTLLMLLIHSLTGPYKRKIYNILDTLLLTNMAIINGLSMFVHAKNKLLPLYLESVHIACAFQALIILLPLIVLLLCLVLALVSKLWKRYKKKSDHAVDQELDGIPYRMIEESQEWHKQCKQSVPSSP